MNLKIATAVAATLAALPLAAQAQGPSYSYLEAAYVETDLDGISRNADGFALRGSVGLTDRVFIFAEYDDQSLSGIDFESYQVGGGYAWPITNRMDLYGRISYVKAEVDYNGFPGPIREDDDGFGVGVGLRNMITDQFELEASINYVDLSDVGDDTTFGIGARWYFTPQFAIGAEANFGDDAKSYGIGLRWNFGG